MFLLNKNAVWSNYIEQAKKVKCVHICFSFSVGTFLYLFNYL